MTTRSAHGVLESTLGARRRRVLPALALTMAALLGDGAGAPAQEPAPEPASPGGATQPLVIEGITVEPADPAADTLCRLKVKLRNAGTQTASQLGFTVKVNGQELPTYRNQLFMFPLDAGATSELKLYNFWSTETSRPAPADGKLAIEVILNEARWMTIGMEGEVEVWTPGDAVPGLPVAQSVTLAMKR